ncbi:MAG: MxaK protein [Gammaproteobacteria bacterium]
MKRGAIHTTFAAVALAFALFAGIEAIRLREALRVNAAVSGAGPATAESSRPEARFARAMAMAKGGDYEGALKTYRRLGLEERGSVSIAALYNAGNLQLREALKEGTGASARALPLIELAKQSYRAALRRDPQSWDARYNLERALWLAPEVEEVAGDRIRRDAEERVMSTLQNTRAELP